MTTPATMTTPAMMTTPGTRTTSDSFQSFPGAYKSELIKIVSIRSNHWIALLAATVSGLLTWAIATYAIDEVVTVAEVFTFATVFTSVFAAIAGILLFSSESQHGTLAPLLTAQPSKIVITATKTAAAATLGVVFATLGMLAAAFGGAMSGLELGDVSTMFADGGRALLFTVLASTLGLGVGMIARHSAAAISGLLVWWLVIENILRSVIAERYGRFLPFTAGNALVESGTGTELSDGGLYLSMTENTLVFGAYGLVAVTLGWFLLNRVETS